MYLSADVLFPTALDHVALLAPPSPTPYLTVPRRYIFGVGQSDADGGLYNVRAALRRCACLIGHASIFLLSRLPQGIPLGR